MGLFGKKQEVLPTVADIFTADELQKIKDVVGAKAENNGYGLRYGGVAKTLMQVVNAPEKAFTKREWRGIIYSAGAMTKLEPEIAPILKSAIAKFHTFKG